MTAVRRHRWAAVVALFVALAGCGFLARFVETEERLNEIGATDVNVDAEDTDGVVFVSVDYATAVETLGAVESQREQVVEIVWRELPLRIDSLVVRPRPTVYAGDEVRAASYSREQLVSRYGARDPDLDEKSFEDVGKTVLRWLLVAGLLFLLFVTAVVVLLVRFFRRRRARRAAAGWAPPPDDWTPPPGWGDPGQAPPARQGGWTPPPGWGQRQQPPPPPAGPPPTRGGPPPGDPGDPWAPPPA